MAKLLGYTVCCLLVALLTVQATRLGLTLWDAGAAG